MKIYEFLYNSCIHESASATVSIHKTREGAEKALELHKAEEYKKWENWIDELLKDSIFNYNSKESAIADNPFGIHEGWYIIETELLD